MKMSFPCWLQQHDSGLVPGLNQWDDIEKLNFFPKLEEVRLQGIPLLQTYTNTERRNLIIAQ